MGKLLIYCHRATGCLLVFLAFSCTEKQWYKREFTAEQKSKLSEQLFAAGETWYYQGSVPQQFLFSESLLHNPDNGAVWRELGAAPVKRGLAVEAMGFYKKAVETDPTTWQGLRGYMYLYFYRDYEAAIADFNATDTLTRDFTDYPQGQSVDYMRGLSYMGLKDHSSAIRFFKKYINEVTESEGEDWVDVYAFLYRGITYEYAGKRDAALSDFKKVIQYSGQLSDPYYHMARVLYSTGKTEKALEAVRQAKKRFKEGNFHYRPYVEVQEQLYLSDIESLEQTISEAL